MPFMVKHLISASAVTLSLWAMPVSAQIVWQPGTGNGTPAASAPTPAPAIYDPSEGNIPAALQRWKMLSASKNYAFSEYASFLMTYPDWPDSNTMRTNAEQSINVANWSPAQVVAYFDKLPPLTNAGRAKYAIALDATGGKSRAQVVARDAWVSGPLTDDDENRIYQIVGSSLAPADFDARVDRLLWSGATRNAQRWIAYTSPARRPAFAAILATKTNDPNAGQLLAQVGSAATSEAGLLAARADDLRNNGNSYAARDLLANRSRLVAPPPVAKDWYKILLTHAQAAANDGQFDVAYRIASKLDDSLAPGVDIAEQDLTTRDRYTSLAWLAGKTAMDRLGKTEDAVRMFRLYANAAKSPQTRSKGFYWAGRAAAKGGNQAEAARNFADAGAYYETFYGQLALEATNRPMPTPSPVTPSPQLASADTASSIFLAAAIAPKYGSWKDQSNFLRAISKNAKTQQDFYAAIGLSQKLGRPDLAVMATRAARSSGFSNFVGNSFPTINVPSSHESNWTLIHAISRQESQFDKAAVSSAGARGLMQLMPGTARETAGKIALSYRPEALTQDTDYNIQLGSTYIQRMLNYYNGSYPLAIAAYNAGPGNVNKWLAANGDPRTGSVDIVDWIEKIPLDETKGYVQRVLENAVMYDHLNPQHARIRSSKPLNTYLGK